MPSLKEMISQKHLLIVRLLLVCQASTPPSPTSIEELLTAEASFQSLIDFLVSDCSVENILFYLDVEAFKRLKRKQDILIQANNLFNKYLITEAELELTTIEAEERKKLTYILANKTSKVKSNFFDTAQKHIFNFLKVCAYMAPSRIRSQFLSTTGEQVSEISEQ